MSLVAALKKIFNLLQSKELRTGLLMLVFAIVIALLSMYPTHVEFSLSGTLHRSDLLDINSVIPEGTVREGVLVLESNHSKIVISTFTGSSEVTIVGERIAPLNQSGLCVSVVEGSVDYNLSGVVTVYPYSFLSYLALLLMISGSIVVNIALIKIFSEL